MRIPVGYEVVKTEQRVGDPDLRTRFRGRAERRCRKLSRGVLVPSYRYEVVREDGRWVVGAYQNLLQPIDRPL